MRVPLTLRYRSQLAAYSIWDSLHKPKARLANDIPWHPDAITPEWLTAVLASGYKGARVSDVILTRGDDGSSVRRALTLTWNKEGKAVGLPEKLFCKTTPTLATRLSAGMAAPNEGYFLLHIRPHLGIEAPVCFFSGRAPTTGRSIHLFEDLTVTQGATFCSVDTRINRSQAEDMIDTLVRLHGPFMTGSKKPAEPFNTERLGTYEDFFQGGLRSGIKSGHDQALIKAHHHIPEKLRDKAAEIWQSTLLAVDSHSTKQRTLIHSDVHLGNWYITSDQVMGLSDWARACYGYWARDLAYVITSALSVEDRRQWEQGLLERYRLNIKESFGISLAQDEVYKGYCEQMFTALLMWTPTLCPPPILPNMQPESMSLEMIKRMTTAIDDHDALKKI